MKKDMLHWAAGLIWCLIPLSAHSGAAPLVPYPSGTTASPMGYYEYLTQHYGDATNRTYGLLIFLHGAGAVGDGDSELAKVLQHGPGHEIRIRNRSYDVIVLIPQSPIKHFEPRTIRTFIQFAIERYRVDSSRIYLTGLSLGGIGTMNYINRYADHPDGTLLAAALPIAGMQLSPSKYSRHPDRLRDFPLWVFHSFGDPVIPLSGSLDFVASIANRSYPTQDPWPNHSHSTGLKSDFGTTQTASLFDDQWYWQDGTQISQESYPLHFTIYSGNTHDAWTETYGNDAVYHWLFSQRRVTRRLD